MNERTEYLFDCIVLGESDVVDIIDNRLGEIVYVDVVVDISGQLIRHLDVVNYRGLW